jgi:CheY-like chemotaxis protein
MLEKILLIDDDIDELFLFEEALHAMNVFPIIYYAENGLDAINKLTCGEAETPQIIFSDINMPVMNGWQFLRKIKSNAGLMHIPVIIYSTSSSKKEVAQALELGAAYFFTKPFHYEQLKFKLQLIAETFVPYHKEIS